ncbi:Poly [ADP-ribose] polymerase 1 [Balamuthia mandrillaris]
MSDVPTYSTEYAKSGRSTCKQCFQRIQANTERVAEYVEDSDYGHPISRYYHVDCVKNNLASFPHCHLFLGGGGGTPSKTPQKKVAKSPQPASSPKVKAYSPTLQSQVVVPVPQPVQLNGFAFHVNHTTNGMCNDCNAYVPRGSGFQCTKCHGFQLCNNCDMFGRRWHHRAVAGPEHSFDSY